MTLTIAMIVVATVGVLVGYRQTRRADKLVGLLLERDAEQRDSRAELVQVFLDEQQRQEQRQDDERGQWRDERGQLLNAILTVRDQPAALAPAWPTDPTEKLYRTEDDEIAEARARVAERIQQQLDIRQPLTPGALGDVAA